MLPPRRGLGAGPARFVFCSLQKHCKMQKILQFNIQKSVKKNAQQFCSEPRKQNRLEMVLPEVGFFSPSWVSAVQGLHVCRAGLSVLG